jgi:hypothetical protein
LQHQANNLLTGLSSQELKGVKGHYLQKQATCQLVNLSTRLLINLKTHKLINSKNNPYEKAINDYPIALLAEYYNGGENKRQ